LISLLAAELALSTSVVAMFAEKRQWGTEYHELESVGTWVRWYLDCIMMYGPKGFSRVWGLSLIRQLTGELGGERAHV
jgi:hypothetical protein